MVFNNAFRRSANAVVRQPDRLLPGLFRQWLRYPVRNAGKGSPSRSEDGQSLVEFALTLSILLGFIFGLMQVCLAFYTYEWISECTREGSRYAMVHGPTCVTYSGASCTVSAAGVNNYVSGIGLPNLAGGVMTPATSYLAPGGGAGSNVDGDYVQVVVTYAFPYKIPFVMQSNLTMTSASTMTIIQ
jgi:Flp pilus assembly protein TadG